MSEKKYNINLMFVVATDSEAAKIVQAYLYVEVLEINGYKVYIYDYPKRVALAVLGIAKVTFAIGTQLMIERFHPKFIFSLGFAGSLCENAKVMDVVIGNESFQYGIFTTRKEIGNLDSPDYRRLKRIAVPQETVDKVKQAINSENPLVVTIGTGDNFLSDKNLVLELLTKEKNLVIDQETAAFYQACYYSGVKFVSIKVITDNCNEEAYNNYLDNVEQAGEKLLQIFNSLIKQDW